MANGRGWCRWGEEMKGDPRGMEKGNKVSAAPGAVGVAVVLGGCGGGGACFACLAC